MLLAGDIGGTKTNLAVFSEERGPRDPLASETLPSGEYSSLEALVDRFLGKLDLDVTRASFGVAGPVVEGRAKITNLPWVIEAEHLETVFGFSSVTLMNDLESIAHAVPFLTSDDLSTLYEGQPADDGSIAVIAPGTGLGEAYLTWSGAAYQAHASEGGHADFAPVDDLQIGLLRYLQGRMAHVSCESVCSGRGMPNIYDYFRKSGLAKEPEWLSAQLTEADDPTPVIVGAALDDEQACEICTATVNTFVSILAAEAANLALKVLATGGVYLAGGIPPRILPFLKKSLFVEVFQRKGRMSDLLARMPLHVIVNSRAPLLGVACYGLELAPHPSGDGAAA